MTRHTVPTKGSGADVALQALYALEGQASIESLRIKVGLAVRPEQWDVVLQVLINTGMIFLRRGLCVLSDEGLVWLGVVAEVVPRAEPEAAPTRYIPPMRPLSAKHLVNVRSMREGAFDYRGIPSRHGDERVAFQTSLNVAGAELAAQKAGCR